MASDRAGRRGVSPVIGNILLAAVVIILGVVVAVFTLGLLDGFGTPTGDAQFEFRESPAGVELVPLALGTDVTIELNGAPVTTIQSDEAGQTVLIPTTPGDRITVVSEDENSGILLSRTVEDRSNVGDLIAQYTFEADPAGELQDRSGNDNDGIINGDPEQVDSMRGAWRFDGSGDYVEVSDLTVDGIENVSEYTVAVAYKGANGQLSDGGVDQLIEHTYTAEDGSDVEWFLETNAGDGEPYADGPSVDFAIEYPNEVASSEAVEEQTRHVVVGSYDGTEYTLYVDGVQVESGMAERVVGMGDACIGADNEGSCQNSQFFNGEMYELRLYYTALEGREVRRVTEVMD